MQAIGTIWQFVTANLEWVAAIASLSAGAGFGFQKLLSTSERDALKQQIALLEAKLKYSQSPPSLQQSTAASDDGARVAAAAVCYRVKDGNVEFLLNLTSGRRWTFPKGKVRPGEAHWSTAERNALEEAGAAGRIETHPIARYKHWKQELKVNSGSEWDVEAYLLEVERQQPPIEMHRDPSWFDPASAKIALREARFNPYADCITEIIDISTTHITTRRLT